MYSIQHFYLIYFSFVGWNELMIAAFSHRSISVKDGIVLATGLTVDRDSAHQAGVEAIFDRVLTELVAKMRDMGMDRTELGCLRTIILFNPGNVLIVNYKCQLLDIKNILIWFFIHTTNTSYFCIRFKRFAVSE